MNMFKKILLIAVVFAVASCSEDFLVLENPQATSTSSAIQTVNDLEASILGVYDGLQSSNYYGRYFVLVPDVMSDDVKQNASANRVKESAEYQNFANEPRIAGIWTTIYNTILRVNVVVNADIEIPAASQSRANHLLGEAYALRALAHFDLARLYGQHYGFTADNSHLGAPIVLEFDQTSEPERNTVAEMYAQVVSDLDQAINLMNEDNGRGRFNKEVAQALKARVMLYMGNYSEAASLAGTVISSGRFSLTSTDNYVSTWDDDGFSPDAVLDVIMNQNDNVGSDALGGMYIATGYGDYLPSNDLFDLIDDNDVRKQLYSEDPAIGGGIFGTRRVDKYNSTQGFDNTPVIRLAEMYLIRAECRARTGDEAGAIEDLMTIRRRGNPNAADVTVTGQALLDEIMTEKRIELCFEGHRLWELMRHKMSVVRNDCTAPASACTITYPDSRFVLPIPQDELNANPNITQNPGY